MTSWRKLVNIWHLPWEVRPIHHLSPHQTSDVQNDRGRAIISPLYWQFDLWGTIFDIL